MDGYWNILTLVVLKMMRGPVVRHLCVGRLEKQTKRLEDVLCGFQLFFFFFFFFAWLSTTSTSMDDSTHA